MVAARSREARGHALLAQALKDARLAAQLTQVELAARLDRTQSYVTKVEANRQRLDVIELVCWARALNVPASHFVNIVEDARGLE